MLKETNTRSSSPACLCLVQSVKTLVHFISIHTLLSINMCACIKLSNSSVWWGMSCTLTRVLCTPSQCTSTYFPSTCTVIFMWFTVMPFFICYMLLCYINRCCLYFLLVLLCMYTCILFLFLVIIQKVVCYYDHLTILYIAVLFEYKSYL